jgi:death-on-curing protein
MSGIEYLDVEDVVEIMRSLGVGPIRDFGLLDSAVSRPQSSAFGEDAYQTLNLKAAALLHSLTKNHALVDGNKRLAWLSTTVFCDLNGFAPQMSDDDAFQLVWDVASSKEEDIASIATRLNLAPNSLKR